MKAHVKFTIEYEPGLEIELLRILNAGSTNSQFNNSTWLFDKLQRSPGHLLSANHSVYFAGIPKEYVYYAKYWVLVRLRDNKKLSTVMTAVSSIKHFFAFLRTECDCVSIKYINRLIFERFYEYLDQLSLSQGTKEWIWGSVSAFFKEMEDWPSMPTYRAIPPGNPFSRSELQRQRSARRPIPESIVSKCDIVFRDNRIPIAIRLIYWLLRSIPSRVQEITSVPTECLLPYLGNWVIRLHNWKQSGSQLEPNMRLVQVQNQGHGAFLLNLIRKQQKFALSVEHLLPKKMRGYLFVYQPVRLNSKFSKTFSQQYGKLKIYNGPLVRKHFKLIARYFGILGDDGQPYNLTTHILRHNAITDRYHAGFNPVEIRSMTQQSARMIGSYIHQIDSKLKISAENKRKQKQLGPAVLFKGRILNMTQEMEERILKRPRAFRIGNLGICSDMTSCTSDLFECLSCPFLVPDFVYKGYYQEQEQLWLKKARMIIASGNRELGEQAQHVANCFKDLLVRLKMGILLAKE